MKIESLSFNSVDSSPESKWRKILTPSLFGAEVTELREEFWNDH